MANSKHISQDEIQYIVDVESSKAQQEIHKLEKESSKLRSENKQRLNQMIQLEAQGKKNTSAYQALRKEYTDNSKKISELTSKIGELTSKLDVNQMTMKQLKKEARDLRRNLEDTSQAANPKEYAILEARLMEVTARMSELRQNAKSLQEVMTEDATQGIMLGNVMTKLAEKFGETLCNFKNFVTGLADEGVEMARQADGITKYIPQNVLKNYETKVYDSVSELNEAAEKITERERRTTIFKVGYTYYIWAELPLNGDPDSDKTEVVRTGCGYFNPIIRDMDSDDSQQLNICPAAMFQHKNYYEEDGKKKFWNNVFEAMGDVWIVMPSVGNEKEVSIEDMEEDDDGNYYISVQDAMEGSTDDTTESKDSDDTQMPVAFQAECVLNVRSKAPVKAPSKLEGEDTDFRIPVLYTDYRMYPATRVRTETASLSLEFTPASSKSPFGNHSAATESRFKTASVDKNNLITIKFITDEIPDPSKIYSFHNKRYICEKVEMNVTDDGIDREKTGYFYEIL